MVSIEKTLLLSDLVTVGSSRIIYQHIKSAELGECQIHQSIPRFCLCDIRPLEDQVGGILCGDFLTTLDIDVGNNDFGAFFTEASCNCSTKSRSRAYSIKN